MGFPGDDDDYNDEAFVDPMDSILQEDISPLPPPMPGSDAGPPGGFNLMPDPIPEATPATMACLRGPCVHYFEAKTFFATQNARGILSKPPKQITRYCRALASPIDLTDELVSDCLDWNPRTPEEAQLVQLRRDKFYQANPDLAVNPEGN